MISHARRWTTLQLSCVVSHYIPIATLHCTALHCTACSFLMTTELHHRNFFQEFVTTVKRERESKQKQAERYRGKKVGGFADIEKQCDIDIYIYAEEEDSRIDARHTDAYHVSVVWICSDATIDTSSPSYHLLCCTVLYCAVLCCADRRTALTRSSVVTSQAIIHQAYQWTDHKLLNKLL